MIGLPARGERHQLAAGDPTCSTSPLASHAIPRGSRQTARRSTMRPARPLHRRGLRRRRQGPRARRRPRRCRLDTHAPGSSPGRSARSCEIDSDPPPAGRDADDIEAIAIGVGRDRERATFGLQRNERAANDERAAGRGGRTGYGLERGPARRGLPPGAPERSGKNPARARNNWSEAMTINPKTVDDVRALIFPSIRRTRRSRSRS